MLCNTKPYLEGIHQTSNKQVDIAFASSAFIAELVEKLADGTVSSQLVKSWDLPTTYKGVNLLSGSDSSGEDYNPQSEGLVIDQQTGMA